MSQEEEIKALHDINKKLLSDPSQSLPAITLADGTKVQTGTMGALLANIKLYDRVCAGDEVEGIEYRHIRTELLTNLQTGMSKELLEQMMTVPIPSLQRVGLFDLFKPDEWISGAGARKFVGTKAKELGF